MTKGYPPNISQIAPEYYMPLLEMAFAEDRAIEDVSTLSLFSKEQKSTAKLIARESGLLAGIEIFEAAFLFMQPNIFFSRNYQDGNQFNAKETIVQFEANTQSILQAERIALNFLGFLSGIATRTKLYVAAAANFKVKVLDTRKTLPGYRYLSKYATALAGAQNHRFDLAEMGMLKDNHLASTIDIQEAIQAFKKQNPQTALQVEVDNIQQLTEVLPANPDLILLDNMNNADLKQCTSLIKDFNHKNNRAIIIEASGGFHIENLDRLKDTGVNYVSIGALTQTVHPLDFSLEIKE